MKGLKRFQLPRFKNSSVNPSRTIKSENSGASFDAPGRYTFLCRISGPGTMARRHNHGEGATMSIKSLNLPDMRPLQ